MSKTRTIETRFWDDNYISDLDPIEKLIFLYLLTNPCTNIIGIYEIPIKRIAVDTGIEKEMVEKILNRFSNDKRVFYINGFICIKNFIKHQNTENPKIKMGIIQKIQGLSLSLIDKLSIAYGYPIHKSTDNSNSNSNSNSFIINKRNITASDDKHPSVVVPLKDFFDMWNEFASKSNLISAREFSARRKQKTTKRLSERPLEEWREVFSLCARTPFLNGLSKDGWKASFDWITASSDNAIKVLEGKYGEPLAEFVTQEKLLGLRQGFKITTEPPVCDTGTFKKIQKGVRESAVPAATEQ